MRVVIDRLLPGLASRGGGSIGPTLLAVVAIAVSAVGCASYGTSSLQVGQSADDVARSMGMVTARYALPGGGTRLEYARGPFGKHTYMVDLDTSGRVKIWTQVLTEANFDAVKPGTPVQDLLMTLGTPSHRRGGGWQGGEVWSYRYQATFCQWFQVSVVDSKVRDASYAPDPMCEVLHDDRVAAGRGR